MARDPYEYFRIEARELIDQLGKGVLDLERGAPAAGHVALLLRAAHTLKGAARVVKQREIAEIAHAIEDVLVPLRGGGEESARAAAPGLLERVDAASALVAKLGARASEAAAQPPPEERLPAARAASEEVGAVIDGMAEVGVQIARSRRAAGAIGRARQLAELVAAVGPESGAAEQGSAGLLRELRGLLEAIERDLGAGLEQAERELRQTREAADRLQFVPVEAMFHVLERAVRDAALSSGKRVVFVPGSSDLRLEPDVLGTLQSALLHAVRNAVAHGVETESARSAQGKPPQGRVSLEVTRRGSRVRFVCADDGKGIDLEAVRRALQRKGLSEEQARRLGREDLTRRLLQGGISTSATVTDVAGRGVGLDAVRDAAARLGGEVAIRTEVGSGTAVEITIPVRASAIDVLLVAVGDEEVALPLDSVRGTLALRGELMARGVATEEMLFDGRMLPFARLERVLARSAVNAVATARSGSAVVIAGHARFAAVGVDRLLGVENVLVRSLPDEAAARAVVAGVCLDGGGEPRLIVDPESLVEDVHRMVPDAGAGAPRAAPPILVIDDSLTTRMLEQNILESAGYRVDVATSGEEGLIKARSSRYGLFLVDVEMPGMDGFTFVERTRADPLLRKVPAILVTSRASIEDRRRGQAAGAHGYMVKSEFDQRELLARIRSLLA